MGDIHQQLIEQVKTAMSERQALTIEGRGTKTFLGRKINVDSTVIATAEHRGIVSYEPVELVMTARSGTPLAEIDAALDENNQMLACDPARFNGDASIGGSLATNQSGPGRPWLGSLRDHVLGVNLINGRGEHLHFGGQVMKNVAGYDISRLQAGAMGTFGVMTEISFKVLPQLEACVTLVNPMDAQEAIYTMNRLCGQPKPLCGACWFDGKLYLRLAGAKASVEKTAERWDGQIMDNNLAAPFWSDLREQQLSFFAESGKDLWRISTKSTAPLFLNGEPYLLDWAGALRWLRGHIDPALWQEWSAQHGGELVLYRGDPSSEAPFNTANAGLKAIYQRLKQSFDPHHIFNPGRLYHWL